MVYDNHRGIEEALKMKPIRMSTMLGLMIILMTPSNVAARAEVGYSQVKTDPQVVAKLAQILDKSGYPYRKATDNIWVVSLKGKSITDMDVFISSAETLIVMGVVIATKSKLRLTPEMMFKVLRLVHDIDRVKIGFDADEDLFLRAEFNSKCLDVEEFKSTIAQVANGSDLLHAAIKPFLTK
jgi:hypothetical protein